MTRELAAALMLAVLGVLLVLMWRGWLRRVARYRDLPDLPLAEGFSITPEHVFSLLYVATTEAGAPLERIARKPLAFRAKVSLGTSRDGVVLDIPGESPVVWRPEVLMGAGRATWTIDRVVDSDGLVFVRWQWGPREVESYFRSVDYPAETIVQAIEKAIARNQEDS